jgi:hypothetical protein
MNFDLFVVSVQDGMPSTITREDLDGCLKAPIAERGMGFLKGFLNLRFPDGSGATLYQADRDRIEHVSINRPSAAPEFYAALLSILQSENLVLLIPGACPPLVGRTAMIAQVPADIIESARPPVLLADAQEIRLWIERALV